MTKKLDKLRSLIRQFEKAARGDEFAGAAEPDDANDIRQHFKDVKAELLAEVRRIELIHNFDGSSEVPESFVPE